MNTLSDVKLLKINMQNRILINTTQSLNGMASFKIQRSVDLTLLCCCVTILDIVNHLTNT